MISHTQAYSQDTAMLRCSVCGKGGTVIVGWLPISEKISISYAATANVPQLPNRITRLIL